MAPRWLALTIVAWLLAQAVAAELPADAWRVPAPGACAGQPPLLLNPPADKDAPPISFPKPGETITNEQAERLRYLLPPELWEKRDRFLFDGMHMEIGPCYRDYGPPQFFSAIDQSGVAL